MIRPARPSDNKAIARLALVILKDMELPFVATYGDETTLAVLEAAILDPSYRYGYGRGIVEEIDGEVAGMAFGYPAEDEPTVDDPFQQVLPQFGIDPTTKLFLDEEAFPNEWYLDTICVDSKFRGHGVGTALLAALDAFVPTTGKHTIGLNVDDANPKAQQLYERLGFENVGECVLNGHRYSHLQKRLDRKE